MKMLILRPALSFIHPQGQVYRAVASNGELPTRCGKAPGPGLKALCCGSTGYWDSRNSLDQLSLCTLAVTSHLLFHPGNRSLYAPLLPEWALWESRYKPGLHTPLLPEHSCFTSGHPVSLRPSESLSAPSLLG